MKVIVWNGKKTKVESERFGVEGTSSVDPHVIPGSDFSQPSTSGHYGRKRKSSFSSPLPEKNQRDSRNGKQHQDLPSVNETNLYNLYSDDSIVQKMTVEPGGTLRRSTSAIISSVLVDEDTDCSEDNISIDYIVKCINTMDSGTGVPYLDVIRKRIIFILEAEGSPHDTEGTLAETERAMGTESDKSLHRREERFSRIFNLPKRYRDALRRHFSSHGINELSVRVHYEKIKKISRCCQMCKIFFSYLSPPSTTSDSDN